MNNNTKHLYIHIPFCKYICTYCDFVRKVPKNNNEVEEYIENIIKEINQYKTIFKTIYIGGGTPNYLNENLLIKLLDSLQKNIDNNTEFTIECNPDFISKSQVLIFKQYQINRISMGVQTTNNTILKLLNRHHTIKQARDAIKLLQENNINNISCDFIYNLPFLKLEDIDNAIQFCKIHSINHISFYALEIKEGSILNKFNHKIDIDNEEEQFEYIIKKLEQESYKRYEISNWAINDKFKSQHNLAYWNLNDWIGIGIGAYGLENRNYYINKGNFNDYKKIDNYLDDKEYYLYVLMMGLRLIEGIELIGKNQLAYQFYKDKLDHSLIEIKNNKLTLKNVNLLDTLLINIV